jgi:predicted metalloendopeptidase
MTAASESTIGGMRLETCRRFAASLAGSTLPVLTLCALTAGATEVAQAPAASSAAPFAGMDRAISPGDDFYGYANGEWLAKTEIPADLPGYGPGYALYLLNETRIAELIRGIAQSHPAAGSDARKVADFFNSFMDEKGIEAKGLTVLQPTLRRVDSIHDRGSLAAYLGGSLRADVDVLNSTNLYTEHLFGLWVAKDLDDPSRYSPFLLQGGLGMPDRDYYVNDSPHMADMRKHYQAHVASVLELAGDKDAARKAAAIFALELKIAAVHATRQESEEVKRGDNHWTRAELAGHAPGIDWNRFFDAAGLRLQTEFVVWQPAAVEGIAALVADQPLDTWKDYLKFHAINESAGVLPSSFVREDFAFYGQTLEGTPKLRDRWKRAIARTNGALGDAVGKMYVEHYFPASTKASIQALVGRLIEAFSGQIDSLEWMAPQTKVKAKAKLATLNVQVGYPDRWRDYSALQIVPGDAYGNEHRSRLFEYRWNLAKLGRPIDRSEWVMEPQTVNAVNLPAMNALNFPAAILQPPYFDPTLPDSINYGSIGAVIGHEISHSFDDQGALFDADGKLQNWWTPEDYAHFKASSAQLVKQFDAYHPLPGLAVKGAQTLSENIADLAGLAIAFRAYHQSLEGRTAPLVDGFNGDQQFFLAFAQSWREKQREAALRAQIASDGHAPDQDRALTLRNIDAWYDAFKVTPGQSLYLAPNDRVRVW